MKVGDLVKMSDTRYHKEIGVVIRNGVGISLMHWSDGRVTWEEDYQLKPVKKV